MLELAAAKHIPEFTSLSSIGATADSGPVKVPIDLGSLACGLVSTDGKAPSAGNGKAAGTNLVPPNNGRPWATLSEYLQQHIPAGDSFDKHLPFPQKTAARLEPHHEAANKGWNFGNVSPPPLPIFNNQRRCCFLCVGQGSRVDKYVPSHMLTIPNPSLKK